MEFENQIYEKKSLRVLQRIDELAKDCVCFANSNGGIIAIGIEDKSQQAAAHQVISPSDVERLHKRILEITVNVQIAVSLQVDPATKGQFIELAVSRSRGVASTKDGQYLLRVGDTCLPLVGEELLRPLDERPPISWEQLKNQNVLVSECNLGKLDQLIQRLQKSNRVKPSVKEKSNSEILEHYDLCSGGTLTNLGILLLGNRHQRNQLGTAPIVQAIRYDLDGNKIHKQVWDDFSQNPIELIDDLWNEISEFKESYEIPDGMFRSKVNVFDEPVVHELLVNTFVHRAYTQRGDIFLNFSPDKLSITSPGRLPLGVTPQNILNQTRRRNEGLARVFHDLELMEREGSGYDLIYERMLATGRLPPTLKEGPDSVTVTVPRQIAHPEVLKLFQYLNERVQLNQRERIAIGTLAMNLGITSRKFCELLQIKEPQGLREWIKKPLEHGHIVNLGSPKDALYSLSNELLLIMGKGKGSARLTSLTPPTEKDLADLVLRTLIQKPGASISELLTALQGQIGLPKLRSHLTRIFHRRYKSLWPSLAWC